MHRWSFEKKTYKFDKCCVLNGITLVNVVEEISAVVVDDHQRVARAGDHRETLPILRESYHLFQLQVYSTVED